MAENLGDTMSTDEGCEIFICGTGGKDVKYSATTIPEINPGIPPKVFNLPERINYAAATLKGSSSSNITYSTTQDIFFFSEALVLAETPTAIRRVSSSLIFVAVRL